MLGLSAILAVMLPDYKSHEIPPSCGHSCSRLENHTLCQVPSAVYRCPLCGMLYEARPIQEFRDPSLGEPCFSYDIPVALR